MTDSIKTVPAPTAPVETPKPSVPQEFFRADQFDAAQAAIANAIAAAQTARVPVVSWTDGTALPEGFGILVRGVATKQGDLQGVVIAHVPTLEAIISSGNEGEQWVRDTVLNALATKLVVAVRPRGEGSTFGGVLPTTMTEFLQGRSRGEGLAAFRVVGPAFVDGLKAKGAKKMTLAALRSICESAAYAKSEYPSIGQDVWSNIIKAMQSRAIAKGESGAIFDHWLSSRDQVEFNAADLNLSVDDLAGLV